MSRPILKSALIVDGDLALLDQYSKDPLFAEWAPVLVGRKKEFKDSIRDPLQRFRAIFISARCYWPSVVSVIKQAHENHPGTPIILMHDGAVPFTPKELSRLAIHAELAKPQTLAGLRAKLPDSANFPLHPYLGKPHDPTLNLEEDSLYLPVAVEEFLSGTPTFFDVFVKMPSGKYLKVLETKDTLTPERVVKYFESGAAHLYFRKSAFARCLEYADFMNENLVVHPEISAEMRMMYTASVGEEFLKFLEEGKVDESHIEPTYAYMARLFSLMKNQAGDRKEMITTYLGNADAMEHAVGVSFACALMTAPLGIQSPNVFKQLGLAAIFHDVGLMAIAPALSHEDESRMSEQERALFETHPEKSAELASAVKGVDAAVQQAIKQHHQRRDGTGFPARGKKGDGIQIFAEVVGICDEFVKLLQRQRREPAFQALPEMEKHHFNSFSFPVIDAFKKTFMGDDGGKNTAGLRAGMAKRV